MTGTAVVLGVGPGLGMSIAHRFGAEGFRMALVSRSAARHDGYVAALAERGVEAAAFAADVTDTGQLRAALDAARARFGEIEMLYYGPGAIDLDVQLSDIRETTAAAARAAMEIAYPALDAVNAVLPGMLERGAGGLLFAGGLSGQVPMPMLGSLVLPSAALRQYVLTLNASLAPLGVYAGALTIGGVIERGDIHAMLLADPQRPDLPLHTLDPDAIAAEAWDLYAERDRAEATFSVAMAG
jgi:NADP-dependent 3-hydroxy acid dehydrogenase YdfG